jgi:hypothetical protein
VARPRQNPLTVADYLFLRCEQLRDLGGEARIRTDMVEGAPDALITARVRWRADRLTLDVFEHVIPKASGHPHRLKYKYLARWRGAQLFRYDRDPIGHPHNPENKHLGSDRTIVWPHRVTVNSVVDEMWTMVEAQKRALRRSA